MDDRLGLNDEFPGGAWLDHFRDREGKIGGSEAILLDILQACPQTAGAIALNTRRVRMEATRRGPWGEPAAWSSTMTASLVVYLQKLGVPASVKRLDTTLVVLAARNPIDPLMDELNKLVWDGVPRIDTWLQHYANAEGKEIICDMGRMFLISMAARAAEPGCQCDYALCLEGDQGIGKTQIARILGGDYFAADLPDFHSRDAQRIASSHWLIEIGELAAVRHSTLERMKTFITVTADTYTEKWQIYDVARKRWSVFLFSVNPDGSGHLVDSTGNRRVWPVTIGEVDAEGLRRDRDQIFAEALARYRAGEKWWPTEKMQWNQLGVEQETRLIEDAWLPVVKMWLSTRSSLEPLTTSEILTHALAVKTGDIDKTRTMRVGRIMRDLGWERYQLGKREERGGWAYRPRPKPKPP